jgi:uncharacterized protein (TIGR02466 family)
MPEQQTENIGALLSLGVQHHEAGRLPQAEALYRRVLELDAGNADALHLLGVLVDQIGQHDKALELIKAAIQHNPRNPHYHANLANVLQALGSRDEATVALERAFALDPGMVTALTNLGALRQQQGRMDEAIAAYRHSLELRPDYADAYYNLATALKEQGKLDEAIATLRQAIALQPNSANEHVVLAGYLLERHDFNAALEACDSCLKLAPRNIRALGFKSVALTELGEREALRALVDFDMLIARQHIQAPPAAYPNLAAFNDALITHVRAHPSLVDNPSTGATRGGGHTDELLVDPKGPFATFEQIINAAVTDYLQSLPLQQSHPYLAQRPRAWRLTVWGVVLRAEGHQVAHIHPGGWVSGVYYAKVPAVVDTAAGDHAGWIEFGQPPLEFHADAKAEVRAVKPEEGLLLLFPSYVYHRTIPYMSKEERVSIAFDVLPQF